MQAVSACREQGCSRAHAPVVLLCFLRSLSCLRGLHGLQRSLTIASTVHAVCLHGPGLALQHAEGWLYL